MEKSFEVIKLKTWGMNRHLGVIMRESIDNKLITNHYGDGIHFKDCDYYHLYFLDTEKTPVVGDYCYDSVNEELLYVKTINHKTGIARDHNDNPFILDGCKKVVATTYEYLLETCRGVKRVGEGCRLNYDCAFPNCRPAGIPESFVKEFVEAQGDIEVVILDCDCLSSGGLVIMDISKDPIEEVHRSPMKCFEYRPKLESNNQVKILMHGSSDKSMD